MALEQAVHAVSEVPAHPPLLYLPAPQLAQVAHEKPLVVPEHDPVRYFPVAQLVLEHVLHVPADVEEWPERHCPEEHDVWVEHASYGAGARWGGGVTRQGSGERTLLDVDAGVGGGARAASPP